MSTLLPAGFYSVSKGFTASKAAHASGGKTSIPLSEKNPVNAPASAEIPFNKPSMGIMEALGLPPISKNQLFAVWETAETLLSRLMASLRKLWERLQRSVHYASGKWSAVTKQDIVRALGKGYTGYVSQPMYELVERQALFSPVRPASLRSLSPEVRKAVGHTRFFPVPELDGIELAAWYMPAKTNQPTVLIHHGRNCNLTSLRHVMKALHQEGFGVFAYDYPGFGKSEGKPSIKTIHLAANAAQQELSRLGIPYAQQIQAGHSLGGAIVTDLVHRLSQVDKQDAKPKALVLINTLSSPQDVLQSQANEYRSFNWIFKRSPDLLKRFPEILDFFNLKQKLSALAEKDIPTLILHSDQDGVFPEKIGQELAKAAQAKAETVPGKSKARYRKLEGRHYLSARLSPQVGHALSDFIREAKHAN